MTKNKIFFIALVSCVLVISDGIMYSGGLLINANELEYTYEVDEDALHEESFHSIESRVMQGITVTFNPNGGSVNPSSRRVATGRQFGTLPRPTRTNRDFVGWFNTSATTGGTRVTNNTVAGSSNRTIWARWNNRTRHMQRWWPSANSGNTTIVLRGWSSPNAQWTNAMNRAFNDWNANSTSIRFSRNSTSNNHISIQAQPPNVTWFGQITRWWPSGATTGGTINRFEIRMNRTRIERIAGGSGTRFNNYVTSVFSHELAHVVGLADNPTGVALNGSIMNHGRNRAGVFRLTNFDITSVRMLYN